LCCVVLDSFSTRLSLHSPCSAAHKRVRARTAKLSRGWWWGVLLCVREGESACVRSSRIWVVVALCTQRAAALRHKATRHTRTHNLHTKEPTDGRAPRLGWGVWLCCSEARAPVLSQTQPSRRARVHAPASMVVCVFLCVVCVLVWCGALCGKRFWVVLENEIGGRVLGWGAHVHTRSRREGGQKAVARP
jgi:hypothetical protein